MAFSLTTPGGPPILVARTKALAYPILVVCPMLLLAVSSVTRKIDLISSQCWDLSEFVLL